VKVCGAGEGKIKLEKIFKKNIKKKYEYTAYKNNWTGEAEILYFFCNKNKKYYARALFK